MFKKNKKQTETIKEPKEKKVRTVKVGTHKKTVIALWVVLIASVSFGVYKNFTAIDQHTSHENEIIELRLQDTNGIENFVKNFAKSYYTWNNSKEAIEARAQAIIVMIHLYHLIFRFLTATALQKTNLAAFLMKKHLLLKST